MSAGLYSRAAGWNWDAVRTPAQDLAPAYIASRCLITSWRQIGIMKNQQVDMAKMKMLFQKRKTSLYSLRQ